MPPFSRGANDLRVEQMKFLRTMAWLLRALLFVALLLFALKNTDPVTLHFYLDQAWQAPLILVILVFFALGAALGVLACLTKLFAQRREILALKKELRGGPTGEAPPAPPSPGL
jgi:putative membrane protein